MWIEDSHDALSDSIDSLTNLSLISRVLTYRNGDGSFNRIDILIPGQGWRSIAGERGKALLGLLSGRPQLRFDEARGCFVDRRHVPLVAEAVTAIEVESESVST